MPIEKVELPAEKKVVEQGDGSFKEETVVPYEIRATGREVQELRTQFKESGLSMAHEKWKEDKKYGQIKITTPDGTVDTVRGDKEKLYRDNGGCRHATRPTFMVDVPWDGSMRRERIVKSKTVWNHRGDREETRWYQDGRIEVLTGG